MTTTTALSTISPARASLPVSYERAKTALEVCVAIDECKDWADRAAALASYAKQANDQTLHTLATRISARAIRRCGELLQTFNKGVGAPKNGGDASPIPTQRQAARDAGLSKDQEKQAVRVANVPHEDFEALVESATPPTVTQLAERGKTAKPTPTDMTFVDTTEAIGRLRALAAFCESHVPQTLASRIHAHEVIRVRAHITTIRGWFDAFEPHIGGSDDGTAEISRDRT